MIYSILSMVNHHKSSGLNEVQGKAERKGCGLNNIRIRTALMEADMKYYHLARRMGISENTLFRKLREELPEEEQIRIIQMIRKKEDEKDVRES